MYRKLPRIFWPILAILIIAASTIAFALAKARRLPLKTPDVNGMNKSIRDTNTGSLEVSIDRQRLEVEPIYLRARGFEPSTISRSRGPFILAIDNRSEFPDLDFRLMRVNGGQEAARKMKGRELRWRQLLNLPPGDYVLTEATHSQWRCEIAITAR